jgi:hypothetical protein
MISENNIIPNTDDTIIQIPKKELKNYAIENGAKKKELTEKINILQEALNKKNNEFKKLNGGNLNKKILLMNNMNDMNEILNNSINKMENKVEDNNKTNTNDESSMLSSIIFKKKADSIREEEESRKNNAQIGGNEEQNKKNVQIAKSEETHQKSILKKTNKRSSVVESESEYDSESDSDSYSDSYSDSDSSSYNSDGDIYRTATATDDGVNKVYKKINNEMDYINRKMKGGKMTNKEVANRINFLLNGLRILDRIKKSGKKGKRGSKRH